MRAAGAAPLIPRCLRAKLGAQEPHAVPPGEEPPMPRVAAMPRLLVTLAFAAVPALPAPAASQDWPTRPMTMVIPFSAAGGVDVVGRIMAARMAEILGRPVVVENIGGAGGMVGSSRVAKAAPDGYQFVLGSVGTHAQNQTLYKNPL